jgi:multicomponent Na+:H+ antiporter subunit C
MEWLLALVVGVISAVSLHLMLTRSFVKVVLGIGLLSNAVNLVIFTAAGLTRGLPALISKTAEGPPEVHADPVPQALVLTAIVITFAIQAFALVLVYRVFRVTGTDDPDALVASEYGVGPVKEEGGER